MLVWNWIYTDFPPPFHFQVLFDDIGPSLICLSSPELRLRLLLHFLSFLGLPVDPVLSAAPCQPGLLLENLSLLIQGKTLNIWHVKQGWTVTAFRF